MYCPSGSSPSSSGGERPAAPLDVADLGGRVLGGVVPDPDRDHHRAAAGKPAGEHEVEAGLLGGRIAVDRPVPGIGRGDLGEGLRAARAAVTDRVREAPVRADHPEAHLAHRVAQPVADIGRAWRRGLGRVEHQDTDEMRGDRTIGEPPHCGVGLSRHDVAVREGGPAAGIVNRLLALLETVVAVPVLDQEMPRERLAPEDAPGVEAGQLWKRQHDPLRARGGQFGETPVEVGIALPE